MWFGLQPPPEAGVAWGARAIVDTRGGYATLDVLADRQQFGGDARRIPALQAWLDKEALPILRRRVANWEPALTDGRSHTLIVIEGAGWRLLASQQGSYGYLYLVAFPNAPATQGGEHDP
jgi:hypothetical protein